MAQTLQPTRAPLLPLVTAVLLLWHLALGADYLNDRFAFLAEAPQISAQLVLPQIWAVVGWGLAVWLGLAAALFMIWRDDAAVLLLFAATLSAVLAAVGDVLASGVGEILGLPRLVALALLVAMPLLGWLYARARHASGHLN